MAFYYEGFGLGKRINGHANNWEPLNPDVYLINKPTVLVVGGSGTEGIRSANGNAKIIQSLLNSTNTDAELLSLYYNGKTPTPKMLEFYTRRFTRDLFKPLLCGGGNKKLSSLEACKNMRNVTIFAHSMGGETVYHMIAELQYMMQDLKYTEDVISKVIKQIFVISYGVTMVTPNVNYLNIVSPSDEQFASSGEACWRTLMMKLMRSENLTNAERQRLKPDDIVNIPEQDKQYLLKESFLLDSPKLIREFYNTHERCYIMQEGDNELRLVTSPLRVSHKDHAITQFSQNKDGTPNINATLAGEYVGKCMALALQHSVNNSKINSQTQEFVPFNMNSLRNNLEEAVKPLNMQSQEGSKNISDWEAE